MQTRSGIFNFDIFCWMMSFCRLLQKNWFHKKQTTSSSCGWSIVGFNKCVMNSKNRISNFDCHISILDSINHNMPNVIIDPGKISKLVCLSISNIINTHVMMQYEKHRSIALKKKRVDDFICSQLSKLCTRVMSSFRTHTLVIIGLNLIKPVNQFATQIRTNWIFTEFQLFRISTSA